MKHRSLVIFLMAAFLNSYAQLDPVRENRISGLLKTMTLEEKVGQMTQVSIESLGDAKGGAFSFNEKMKEAVSTYKIGSILNSPGPLQSVQDWNRLIEQIQNMAGLTRLKIPVLYGLDDIHGVNYVAGATLFPQQIGMAATWNRELLQKEAEITAYESRAAGVPWTFSPVLDLGVNPVWPRIWEGYGEDPFLTAELGKAFVKAVQEPLGSKEKLAVSLKHFLAYSDPKSDNDRTDAWIPEHYLREYHLPPFAAVVKAGARTVMVNSALINGVPTHVNKHLLTDILKVELGFTGFIVTDWQDIENIYRRDHMTNNIKEAIALAINAGNDMSMLPYDYKQFTTDLIALVKEGTVSQGRIDDAVRRILRVKMELGLFETPMTYAAGYPKFGSKEFEQAAWNTAAESITLLKNNNGILPLKKDAKILVTGPNANSMRTLNGGWTYTWQGDKTDVYGAQYHTILEALQLEFGKANVIFSEGVAYKMKGKFNEDSVVNLAAVANAAAQVDYVVLCVGENSYTETPGNLTDLNLTENQVALARSLYQTGKPVLLVLNEGRPRIINKIEAGASAILHIYLPGNFGGDALADILSGDVNPSGKLPITYPRNSNGFSPYIHKPSEGGANPQGGEFAPQYPFGFGLSYTSFEYSELTINKKTFSAEETATISLRVTNTGTKEGKEVVQLFTSDLVASFTPDVKRLRAFEKINLKAGETKTVTFKIPIKSLAFVNTSNKKQLEKGEFKLQVAGFETNFTVNETIIF